ncbi:hypothetical protein [Arthrobacter sp. MDT1-65]
MTRLRRASALTFRFVLLAAAAALLGVAVVLGVVALREAASAIDVIGLSSVMVIFLSGAGVLLHDALPRRRHPAQ